MMNAPRLEVDVGKIYDNAHILVELLATQNISVTGVTKATLGSTEIAKALLQAGVNALGDSRIENIELMRGMNEKVKISLIRSPMLSQVDEVVLYSDVSHNTELDVISALSAAAQRQDLTHGIILMVELGDLREGIMPCDMEKMVRETLKFSNVAFKGIGTNLACRSGVSPDVANMGELSALADSLDTTFGFVMETISGGNSSNLSWVLSGADTGRINNLRLGEAILLGCDPLSRMPIADLHTDAITLIAEVIESKTKPTKPRGKIAQTAFGSTEKIKDEGLVFQTLLAIGEQDIDPNGLSSPEGIEIIGASSDHLILNTDGKLLPIGSDVIFIPNYSALLRAMTSPFVKKIMT
jgi:predicted amino acid racemase